MKFCTVRIMNITAAQAKYRNFSEEGNEWYKYVSINHIIRVFILILLTVATKFFTSRCFVMQFILTRFYFVNFNNIQKNNRCITQVVCLRPSIFLTLCKASMSK